jgi:H+/Cl- antiporter ClcA
LAAAVSVGIGAGTVSILRLPLSAIVIATLLTGNAGAGVTPLTIIGVVVAYLVTVRLAALQTARAAPAPVAAKDAAAAAPVPAA